MGRPLLEIEGLSLQVPTENGPRRILDRVSFVVHPDEVVGLVGESGSGKTMTALAIIGLLPSAARLEAGRIWFDGNDLLGLPEQQLREVRGRQIAMIFQNPRASLNPLMRAGDQVARAIRLHRSLGKTDSYELAIELLRHVGIADAPARARAYPHQLSGGMAQRVLIAVMLACQPRLLIADEPTTGLDVTIQAQIFELIKEVQAETGAALLLITHDLGVVSEICQRVAVMYAGQIMEVAGVEELFANPKHPYTEMLMGSVLRVDRPRLLEELTQAAGAPARYELTGCRFASRCPYVYEVCWKNRPPETAFADRHHGFCYRYVQEAV
ncbi:MAG: ABC transporter ATP-binding protein [Anaerolineales bacterium]